MFKEFSLDAGNLLLIGMATIFVFLAAGSLLTFVYDLALGKSRQSYKAAQRHLIICGGFLLLALATMVFRLFFALGLVFFWTVLLLKKARYLHLHAPEE